MQGSVSSQQDGKQRAFEVEYDFYFKNNHGISVMQAQMKYMQLLKIQKSINLKNFLMNVDQFEEMKSELY